MLPIYARFIGEAHGLTFQLEIAESKCESKEYVWKSIGLPDCLSVQRLEQLDRTLLESLVKLGIPVWVP